MLYLLTGYRVSRRKFTDRSRETKGLKLARYQFNVLKLSRKAEKVNGKFYKKNVKMRDSFDFSSQKFKLAKKCMKLGK